MCALACVAMASAGFLGGSGSGGSGWQSGEINGTTKEINKNFQLKFS